MEQRRQNTASPRMKCSTTQDGPAVFVRSDVERSQGPSEWVNRPYVVQSSRVSSNDTEGRKSCFISFLHERFQS